MRLRSVGSLVVLVAGLSLVMGCAKTDIGVAGKVKAKFAADDVVKASQIEVTASNGVITLTGNVDSEDAKNRALALARATTGVTSVVDMISARKASGSGDAPHADRTVGEVLDDSGITMSVKGRLLDDPQVKGLQIDVDTRDGVVFLTGNVGSDSERQKAIQLAKDTKGVKSVQANLTLKV